MSKKQDIDNAWSYYKHADTVNATRSNFFLATQGIFINTVFGIWNSSNPVTSILPVIGLIISIVWWLVNCNIGRKMKNLHSLYLNTEKVYNHFLGDIKPFLSSAFLLNRVLPAVFTLFWLFIIFHWL